MGLGTSNRLAVPRRAPVCEIEAEHGHRATFLVGHVHRVVDDRQIPGNVAAAVDLVDQLEARRGPGSTRKLATVFGPRLAITT